MPKHKNTPLNGSVRCIVFREENVWYAVGLEFNIVESGSSAREAFLLLSESLTGYVESAKKMGSKPAISILNQQTDTEYDKLWNALQKKKPIRNKQVSFFGEMNISVLQQMALA